MKFRFICVLLIVFNNLVASAQEHTRSTAYSLVLNDSQSLLSLSQKESFNQIGTLTPIRSVISMKYLDSCILGAEFAEYYWAPDKRGAEDRGGPVFKLDSLTFNPTSDSRLSYRYSGVSNACGAEIDAYIFKCEEHYFLLQGLWMSEIKDTNASIEITTTYLLDINFPQMDSLIKRGVMDSSGYADHYSYWKQLPYRDKKEPLWHAFYYATYRIETQKLIQLLSGRKESETTVELLHHKMDSGDRVPFCGC